MIRTLIDGRKLVLASSSPRRRELLAEAGFEFDVRSADIDESVLPGEKPEEMVRRLARGKAQALLARFPEAVILGADTTVVVDGSILGKPTDKVDAAEMLGKLQGSVHVVWTGFSLQCAAHALDIVEASSTEVKMVSLSPIQIQSYIETGEPMDKAGAYAIQGQGAQLIEWVRGSYTSVVGLNVSAVVQAFERHKLL